MSTGGPMEYYERKQDQAEREDTVGKREYNDEDMIRNEV